MQNTYSLCFGPFTNQDENANNMCGLSIEAVITYLSK